MKDLLVSPPVYSFDTTVGHGLEYPIALMRISTNLKKLGHHVEMFDFIPKKKFYTDRYDEIMSIRDNGFCVEMKRNKLDILKCFKSQDIGLNRLSFGRKTGDVYERFGRHFERTYIGIEYDLFVEYIKNYKPDRVWLSSGSTTEYRTTIEVIDICKRVLPGCKVILGGIYPTLCHEHALKNCGADEVIKGRDARFDWEIMDINVLPNDPEYIVETISTGCPNRCHFCSVYAMEGNRVEFVDIAKSMDYIARAVDKYDVHNLKIYGSNPISYMGGSKFKDWMRGIIKLNRGMHIEFPTGVAPELATQEIFDLMRESGFISASIPLDSGNDNSLRGMNKKCKISDWEKAVGMAFKAGFNKDEIEASCILGAVGQTRKDIEDIISRWSQFGILPCFEPYTFVPGSKWYNDSEYAKSLDYEFLSGIFLPAVNDPDLADFIYSLLGKEREMENKIDVNAVVMKMAQILVDISEQNEEIIRLLKEKNTNTEDKKKDA